MDDIGNLGLYIALSYLFVRNKIMDREIVLELLVHSIDGVVNQHGRFSLCMCVYL